MSFFKDFKEDLSTAADELLTGNDSDFGAKKTDGSKDIMVDTFSADNKDEKDLAKIDTLLEKVTPADSGKTDNKNKDKDKAQKQDTVSPVTPKAATTPASTGSAPLSYTLNSTTPATSTAPAKETLPVSDETTVITSGTVIRGDIESTGSLDISGEITGDVKCRGKLTVTGTVNGNSSAEEVFADSAHISGEIVSNGTVKIGLGSIVIGNVSANSAVVAGAIKGDIDVHGPVVVDTSAVVMGNIKSRSVQINNGAVIEGFCSQAYAEIDVNSLFGGK